MFCQKGGTNLKRVVDTEIGGCYFFYYFAVQFNHICIFRSSVLSQPCKIFIHVLIQVLQSCTKTSYYWHTSDPFWYGSLQKILTAFLKQLYKSFPILYAPFGSRVKHLPIVQNLNISLNFCARLDFNVIWFVKYMKIRPIIVNYLFIVTHPHRKNLPQNAA